MQQCCSLSLGVSGMDFSTVVLTDAQQAFADEVRAFFDEHLTPELYAGIRERADHTDEGLILALGAKGWLMPQWPKEEGGAARDNVCLKIVQDEIIRRDAPCQVGEQLPWPAVDKFANPELRAELKPKVASGEGRFCLGYSESGGGSASAGGKSR